MLRDDQFIQFMTNLESDQVERTVSTTKFDKFAEAICAFSNDMPNHGTPGYLLIGVDDKGNPSGLKVTDGLQQTLAAIRSDGNINPIPEIHVYKKTHSEGDVAVVEVMPSDIPPVRYKGRTWIRVGSTTRIATESEERRLSERRTDRIKTFDARAHVGSNLEDLALEIFSLNYLKLAVAPDIIAENHRDIQNQLASLRLYDLKKNCVTNAGLILFAKNVLEFLPGAYIQFVRINGTSPIDPVADEKELSGDLLTILRAIDVLLKVYVQSPLVQITPLREKSLPEYPIVALRELILNAIIHRSYEATAPIRFYWYSDRIEIQNPGGLYGEATPENFPNQSAYRNPVIAEAVKTLGYVNKYGFGVQRAKKALADNNNPPPTFKINDPHYVLVTIWK